MKNKQLASIGPLVVSLALVTAEGAAVAQSGRGNRAIKVAAVNLPGDVLDVYMIGIDNRLWHSMQNASGGFPDFAGGPVGEPTNRAKDIAVTASTLGGVRVFMVGMDGKMWTSALQADGTYPNFASHPVGSSTNIAKAISAVANADGTNTVFMVGTDGRIWASRQTSVGGNFPDFAGMPVGDPSNRGIDVAAVRRQSGTIEVFMAGLDGRIWQSTQDANGRFPQNFAVKPVGDASNKAKEIAAAVRPDGGIDVAMVGLDGRMWRSRESNGAFANFAQDPVGHATNIATTMALAVAKGTEESAFMVGMDCRMWRSTAALHSSFNQNFASNPVGNTGCTGCADDRGCSLVPPPPVVPMCNGVSISCWGDETCCPAGSRPSCGGWKQVICGTTPPSPPPTQTKCLPSAAMANPICTLKGRERVQVQVFEENSCDGRGALIDTFWIEKDGVRAVNSRVGRIRYQYRRAPDGAYLQDSGAWCRNGNQVLVQ